MATKKKVTISWSGGKDSAWALHKILTRGDCEVVSLHTVINDGNRRVGLHGVHEDLISEQARALGIPLEKLYLRTSDDHGAYEILMKQFYKSCASNGVDKIVFGDIFLEDLKDYRDKLLEGSGIGGLYPLWNADTRGLLKQFLRAGFKTIVCAAKKEYFSKKEMGRIIDETFLSQLDPAVDPCGENGEFHTFVVDGPIFKFPITIRVGGVIETKYSYKITGADGSGRTVDACFLFQDLFL
ncbi:MAG TPA: diphthine--ammonia ligase [Chryseosolibacter sp.]|nr:diphthine--ammonia ligase [Chryseosolibacter sp.]